MNFSIEPQTKLCGWLLWQIPPIWKVYNFFVFYTVEILLCNAKPHQQKSLLILNFQFLIFFFKVLLLYPSAASMISQISQSQ